MRFFFSSTAHGSIGRAKPRPATSPKLETGTPSGGVEKVTAGATVSDKDIADYYKKNKQNYVQPASRDVRHILVKKKALADSLYQRVQNGENFAALAKKFSTDPSS